MTLHILAFNTAGGMTAVQGLSKGQSAAGGAAPASPVAETPPPPAPEDPNADDERPAQPAG